MKQRDTNTIRLGMLAGLIRVARALAGMWDSPRDVDTWHLLDTAVDSLQKAHDLATAPAAPIEVPND